MSKGGKTGGKWDATHSANLDEKVHKPQSWCDQIWLEFPHLRWIWILLSMHYNFLVSEVLQGTYLYECIKPIKFKIDDIAPTGGLWTF